METTYFCSKISYVNASEQVNIQFTAVKEPAKLLEEVPEKSVNVKNGREEDEEEEKEGNKPSGGRRSSFVGTAQYVSPEVSQSLT